MKNVITRSLTGIVYIALIVGAILGGDVWMMLLCCLFTALGINEFNTISDKHDLAIALNVLDIAGGVIMILAGYFICSFSLPAAFVLSLLFVAYLMARCIAALYIKKGDYLADIAHSFMAQLYVALPLALLMATYMLSMVGHSVVLLMFIMIWLNDTGAFCVGSLIGRHRLFERVSPKKSWEGFFGGLIFAVVAGVVAYLWLGESKFKGISLAELAIYGALVSIFATWGDLVESQIKRTLGIKDSGNILPGHGGILDRIDSLLMVAPFTFIYLLAISIFL